MTTRTTARRLLDVAGTTYAAQADITLRNRPEPLYRLLVLSVLLSTRIKAEIAVAAGRELAEFDTPERMLRATWQQRVDALGRGHYVRYDESTATALGQGAELLRDEYGGDPRGMRTEADGDPAKLRSALRGIPKLGPVGADIFCREAQAVWPELRPYFDKKALTGAQRVGLPGRPAELAELVEDEELARLAAACVRVTLEKGTAEKVAQPSATG
ncbi:endonuclease [Actinopolyspora sp. H202]|uniref:endonuclease n=1 Tax=Actinopolyspora sp. H202 TaxID=1500456 RepID=UPI003EE5DFD5